MEDKDIEELSNIDEKEKKHLKIMNRLFKIDDYLIHKFFDIDSYDMLDEKIEVLDELIKGKVPSDIPNYYKILEKFPQNKDSNDVNWD